MKSINLKFIGLIAFLAIAVLYGCRKKEDTIAIIKIRNNANEAVAGAQVILYGKSTTNQPSSVVLYDTTNTNAAGEATFNFNDTYQLGQAGVAVLDIQASKDGMTGQGIIKVEEETTSEETVFIQ